MKTLTLTAAEAVSLKWTLRGEVVDLQMLLESKKVLHPQIREDARRKQDLIQSILEKVEAL
jgi:hypothetical protein